MVPDHFVDDEAKEFFGKLGIEIGLLRQLSQPRDLARLAVGIGRGQGGSGLVFADCLRDPEPFGEHMDDRGIDIVDALAEGSKNRIWLGRRLRFVGHRA